MAVRVKDLEFTVKKHGFYPGGSRDPWKGFKLGRDVSGWVP